MIQVRVGNEQGFGPWSDSLTDRSRSRPQPIHRPTVTVGDGSLKVTWPQFSDAADIDYTGYYLYWIESTAYSQFLLSRWTRSEFIPSVDPCDGEDGPEDLQHVISGLSNDVSYKVVARAQTSWGDLSTPFHLNQASLGTPSASAGSQTAATPEQCSPSSSEDEVQSDRQVTMDSGTETVVTDTKNVGEGGETETKDEEESSEPP